MSISTSAARRSRYIPLELRLPFLIVTLLSAALVAIVWASYAEVERAARLSASSRVANASAVVAATIERGVAERLSIMREIAADPDLVTYLLSGDPRAEVEARRAVDRLGEGADSIASVVEIISIDGLPLPDARRDPAAGVFARDELAAATAAIPASGGYGPLFVRDGRAYYWSVAPVRSERDRIGWIAQPRELETAASRSALDPLLLGSNTMITSLPGDLWLTLDGGVVTAPASWPFTGSSEYVGPDGEPRLGHETLIAGTAWSVVAELPTSEVRALAQSVLRRIAAIGALLILVVGCLAWLLGRRVTRSVGRLRVAAQAVASGNYDERVDIRGGGELADLGATFNDMAVQVRSAQRHLELQPGDARELAAELVRANAELEERIAFAEGARASTQLTNQSALEFLATLSHELRAPINAMIGYAELLELEVAGPLTEQQRDQVSRIRTSGGHLTSLVDEVLDVAGIESGRIRIEPRVALLEEAAEAALAIVRPDALVRGVALTEACGCESNSFYFGDPRRVEQIVVNLVSNAVKFTPAPGRVHIWCRTVERDAKAWSQVIVEDTGVGIPADQLERIFEPFVRVDSGRAGAQDGVGLGLAISRRLARLMDGEIAVHSRPGEGSRFTLELPAAPETVSAASPDASPQGSARIG